MFLWNTSQGSVLNIRELCYGYYALFMDYLANFHKYGVTV